MHRLKRPSPAMIVASIALLVALGGTSIAAISVVLPPNSVGAIQLRSNAVTNAKVATNAITSAKVANGTLRTIDFRAGQLPVAKRGATGPPGPTGPAAQPKWALVAKDGTIVAQSGNIALAGHPGPGQYILDFGAEVTSRPLLVSLASAGPDVSFHGSIYAGPCGTSDQGGKCTVGDDTNHAWVITQKPNGTANEDHAFYIVVFG